MTQLDLFGQVQAAEARAAAAEAKRAAEQALWEATAERFRLRATVYPDGTPVVWTAPCDTAGGMKEGDTQPGWWCWLCGQVNSSAFLLQLNHGLYAQDDVVHERTRCTNDRDDPHGYSRESWQLRAAR